MAFYAQPRTIYMAVLKCFFSRYRSCFGVNPKTKVGALLLRDVLAIQTYGEGAEVDSPASSDDEYDDEVDWALEDAGVRTLAGKACARVVCE